MTMERIKSVLITSSLYKPHFGGIETVIDKLTRQYQEQGVNVQVFTKQYPYELSEFERIDAIPIHRIRRPISEADFIASTEWIEANERQLRSDVVHIVGVRRPLPLHALMMSRLWGVPFVASFAGGDLPNPDEPEACKVWREGVGIVPESLKQADWLTTFSKSTRRLALETIPDLSDIDIIYAGIELNEISKVEPYTPGFEYFVTARRLIHAKGIDVLIKAYHKAKNDLNNAKLLIVGEGPEKGNLTKLIAELGLEEDIYLTGQASPTEVFSYMKGSIGHLCPSRSEGGGIVNFEAQAAGCIAIGSNVGGIPEYIEDGVTGLLFDSEDIDGLARTLIRVRKNQSEMAAIKQQAGIKIQGFDWKSIANRYLLGYVDHAEAAHARTFTPWSDLTYTMWRRLTS